MKTITGLLSLLLLCAPACLIAQTSTTPADHFDQLRQATDLTRDGIRPWHMQMSFQIFDLDGKPSEKGTVEVWFAGKSGERVVVDSPSLKAVWPGDVPAQATRSSFLIESLLTAFEHPVPRLPASGLIVTSEKHAFGKSTLDCLRVANQPANPKAEPSAYQTYCYEPGTNILRLSFTLPSDSERNGNGLFLGTQVALNHSIAFGEHVAISGHVDKLEVWDPARDPKQVAPALSHTIVSSVIAVARSVYRVAPNWTRLSGQGPEGGSVVLGVRIDQDGSVGDIILIATPSLMLAGDAMNAFKQWRFAPALLNGRPTAVWTTFTANFFGPRRH